MWKYYGNCSFSSAGAAKQGIQDCTMSFGNSLLHAEAGKYRPTALFSQETLLRWDISLVLFQERRKACGRF